MRQAGRGEGEPEAGPDDMSTTQPDMRRQSEGSEAASRGYPPQPARPSQPRRPQQWPGTPPPQGWQAQPAQAWPSYAWPPPMQRARPRHPIVTLIFGLFCGVGALYGAAFVLFVVITGAGPVMPNVHPEDGAPYYGVLAVSAALPLLTFVFIAYQSGKRLGRLGAVPFALGAVGPMALGTSATSGIDASAAAGLAAAVALASVPYVVGASRSSVPTRS